MLTALGAHAAGFAAARRCLRFLVWIYFYACALELYEVMLCYHNHQGHHHHNVFLVHLLRTVHRFKNINAARQAVCM